MENTCIYLRKSRADIEAESHGEGETLERHQHALLRLAKQKGLIVSEIYKEVVSGETIASRPKMQQLLSDIESGTWDNVLVMEVERLARGDTIDQGIVAQAFKYSNTNIITPVKTFDPNNEFDEEYFEFGLFMSRREYKTTKRRLIAGKIAAVNEGKYPFSTPPYGYDISRCEGKGFTLSPNKDESEIVKIIFDLYISGKGPALVARHLNNLSVPTRTGKPWTYATLKGILSNPVYTGKVRYGRRSRVKSLKNSNMEVSRPISNEYTIVDGIHIPLVDNETFDKAQDIFKQKSTPPVQNRYILKNPLAGILKCSECGRNMIRRPHKDRVDGIMCQEPQCKTVSSDLYMVEDAILVALKKYLKNVKIKDVAIKNKSNEDIAKHSLELLRKEHKEVKKQLNNIYDLLEKGVYDTDTFLNRSEILKSKIATTEMKIKNLEEISQKEENKKKINGNFVPVCEYLLDNYNNLTTLEKNDLLKKIFVKITYRKLKKNRRGHGNQATFEIELFPRLYF
ncbi:recombinase family protein [Anaerosacchariphilus polymeriproducens]|uniref:Recombinase family protein n=1 Tax=Anaerosacchariphilus polymeriproducens TaxID=1812858 RepID=A0A371AUE6_9FIRM|nr:recombinase family protein [Anaerosacchariphilus polymeriproducens]RDU23187.1 recombinase family protein [Anaerosacchariphilus polymeriproducens]